MPRAMAASTFPPEDGGTLAHCCADRDAPCGFPAAVAAGGSRGRLGGEDWAVAFGVPASSTTRHSFGSSVIVRAGFAGAGLAGAAITGGAAGGGGGAGLVSSAYHSVSSLPQPSSPGTGACVSQVADPAGQSMRMWK